MTCVQRVLPCPEFKAGTAAVSWQLVCHRLARGSCMQAVLSVRHL